MTTSYRTHDLLTDAADHGTAGVLVARPSLTTSTITTGPSLRTRSAERTSTTETMVQWVQAMSQKAKGLHQDSYIAEWRAVSDEIFTKRPVLEQLEELSEMGFSWRGVAKMLGVSVPATQKWRRGEGVSSENRRRLSDILGACELLTERRYVADVVSWLEVPLVPGIPVTPIDLWAAGEQRLVFQRAIEKVSPEEVLTRFQPDWRERYQSDFETFRDVDGNLGLRMKD